MYSAVQKIIHLAKHSMLVMAKPRLLPKIAEGYFKALVLKRPVLRTIEVAITPECNTLCEMCYASRLKKKDQPILRLDEYRNVWAQAKKLGAFSVIISGGEPTFRPDFLEVVKCFEPGWSLVAVVSNGIETEKHLKGMAEVGVRTLHLSLDSTTPAIHDRIRRHEGNFSKTMSAIAAAKKLGFNTYISSVICHGGLEKMAEMVEFARREEIGIVFSLACPTGEKAGKKEYVLTPDEWAIVKRVMAENPHIRADWTINLSGREVTGCGMNFISFGNIREEPLAVIWRRMQKFPPFAARSENCLIGADHEYIDKYLLPLSGHDELPVRIHDHPTSPISFSELDDE